MRISGKMHLTAFTLVDPGSGSGVTSLHKGFTLVELLIVVSILGILAAIVLPEFQGHAQMAKEAAAKDNLRILRETIERYALKHNGIAPGFMLNDPTKTAAEEDFYFWVVIHDKVLTEVPINPLNGLATIKVLNSETMTLAQITGDYGWVYKPATKEIKLDQTGNDSRGNSFYSY